MSLLGIKLAKTINQVDGKNFQMHIQITERFTNTYYVNPERRKYLFVNNEYFACLIG